MKEAPFSGIEKRVTSEDEKISNFKELLYLLRGKKFFNEDDFNEILEQRKLLDSKRDILSQHQGQVVVVCGGELFFGNTLDEAVKKARKKYKDKPSYSESIGLIDIPAEY